MFLTLSLLILTGVLLSYFIFSENNNVNSSIGFNENIIIMAVIFIIVLFPLILFMLPSSNNKNSTASNFSKNRDVALRRRKGNQVQTGNKTSGKLI